jgi:hypothetical protein
VLIDDGPGARIATSEISRLQRLRSDGRAVGSVGLASTLTVLERAAGGQHISDKAATREIYMRLRGLDDGLPPIETTKLLSSFLWRWRAAAAERPSARRSDAARPSRDRAEVAADVGGVHFGAASRWKHEIIDISRLATQRFRGAAGT